MQKYQPRQKQVMDFFGFSMLSNDDITLHVMRLHENDKRLTLIIIE